MARAGRFNGGGFIVLEERLDVVLGDTSVYTSWMGTVVKKKKRVEGPSQGVWPRGTNEAWATGIYE